MTYVLLLKVNVNDFCERLSIRSVLHIQNKMLVFYKQKNNFIIKMFTKFMHKQNSNIYLNLS
jgi:phage pi2 protein 07